MKNTLLKLISVVFIVVLIISACSTSETTQPPATEEPTLLPTEVPTAEPATTEEPAPIPCTIAFDSERDGNLEVYTMNPDGSNTTNLTNDPANDSDPSWSPDGSQIAFVSNRENDEGVGGQFIYIMDADGSNVRQLSMGNESSSPDWSNDGKAIVFSSYGDIFVTKADGSAESINLTNSPENDTNPVWSPDNSQIAWLSGDEKANLFVMNADGSDPRQLTFDGKVYNVEWTVDGQLFAHWENQESGCFNCVMDADGLNVKDAGGKGEIQKYLPFWTLDGNRVECVSVDINSGNDEIYLVGEIFPDMFLNLTNNPAHDRNPDWPAKCSGTTGTSAASLPTEPPQVFDPSDMVIGYEAGDDQIPQRKLDDLKSACDELQIQCVQGKSKTELAEQGVDVILSFSNRWRALGDFPEIWEITGKGTPVIVLDGESDAAGAYNLSIDSTSVRSSLEWMFKGMGEAGEFVYYNIGQNGLHQSVIEEVLKEFPGIKATAMPADFEGNSFSTDSIASMVASNPNLGAIWSDGQIMDIFWGLNDCQGEDCPAILCEATPEGLEAWKNKLESDPSFECYSFIPAGGTAYEGVYVAYYMMTGLEIDQEALTGRSGNSFSYDYPVITSETLSEWMQKIDTFKVGDWNQLEMPPMTPDEIKEKWFLE